MQKLWKRAYSSRIISEFGDVSDETKDNYICDIRELDMPNGIYEVFKYCFKDMDIKNLDISKDLYFGLKRKRLRQGYGKPYNVKVDGMTEKHRDYRKVSITKFLWAYYAHRIYCFRLCLPALSGTSPSTSLRM